MYIAIISFCNNDINIKQGEILESDFASAEEIADLLAAGYIELYTAPDEGISIEDVEEITGNLSNLSTTDKTTLVNAINEVVTNMGDLSIQELQPGTYDIENLSEGIYIPGGEGSVIINVLQEDNTRGQYRLLGVLVNGISRVTDGNAYVDKGYYTFQTYTVINSKIEYFLVQGYYEHMVNENNNEDEMVGEYSATIDTIANYVNSVTGDLANLDTTDKSNLVSAINEVASSSGSAESLVYWLEIDNIGGVDWSGTINLSNNDLTKLSAIVKEAYDNGQSFFNLIVTSTTGWKRPITFTYGDIRENIQNKTTEIMMYSIASSNVIRNNVNYQIYSLLLDIGISWNNNIPTVTNGYIYTTKNTPLMYDNTQAYTVSNDYQPAHKKYVDDSIAAAITTTLGGSY